MSDQFMLALRLHGRQDIRLDTVPLPKCSSDRVRIRIAYCGICGSDIHEYQAGPILAPQPNSPNPFTGVSLPITLGHEISGTITEIGSEVAGKSTSLYVGQKVVVNPLIADAQHRASGGQVEIEPCLSCLSGQVNTCKRATYYGISAEGGGLSSEIVVAPENIVPVPDNVDLRVAALAEPLAVACHMIDRSGFKTGDNVLILGAGPIGLALLILLRAKGCGKVIMSEVSALRIKQAERFGADYVVNPLATEDNTGRDPVLYEVLKVTQEGVDMAFDASGLQATLDTAIASVHPGGTIFNVAIHDKPLTINLNDISLPEKRLTGGICYLRKDFEEVLELLSSTNLPAEQMITSVVRLSDAIEMGFQELIVNKTKHVKILIQPEQ
ncbi:chaperonin 10-like protein [Aspergillus tetrazonus]